MPRDTVITITYYRDRAGLPAFNYSLGDAIIPLASILGGILLCLLVYDLIRFLSSRYIKNYATLTKIQQIEWSNRGVSTIHAIFITAMSLYFVFWSNLFSDPGIIMNRSSTLSTISLGVTTGYFIVDLGMIIWVFPCLGGLEYGVHHLSSGLAVAYSAFSGEGQLYAYMILISEITTPEINIRWYLDKIGMKKSIAYLINGVVIFFAWLVARLLLFVYFYHHMSLHFDQVIDMHLLGFGFIMYVPPVLAMMNLVWFVKIIKGLVKHLTRRRR